MHIKPIALSVFLAVIIAAPATPHPAPYLPGEELVYRVFYTRVPAGTVTMTVGIDERDDGAPGYIFSAEANSSPPFSFFYRVRNRMESRVDSSTLLPLRFEKRRQEASFRREITADFDRSENIARVRVNREAFEREIPEDAQDYLSSLYHLRTLELEPGTEVCFNATSGNRNHNVVVEVIRREKVRKWGRDIDTIVISPVIGNLSLEGMVQEKAEMLIWLTDDEKRIPLRFEIDVAFGRLNVVLINYREE